MRWLPLLAGLAAIVAGTVLGSQPGVLAAIVEPPAIVRAGLIGASVAIAIWLLGGAVRRLADAGPDVRRLIRGVRLVFLAVAALAAATGWLLASPLPLVVGLIIAGIDIVETSFLLIVAGRRSPEGAGEG